MREPPAPPGARVASSIVVAFHAVESGTLQIDHSALPASLRYVVRSHIFAEAMARLAPERCCTAAEFDEKSGSAWQILTFDDGYATDFEVVFPILRRHGLKGTFFVNVDNIDRKGYTSATQLREMKDAGMEIGSHGLSHHYLITMARPDAIREIRDSKTKLEERLETAVRSFAPVGGHFARWMVDLAADSGYSVFASMIPGRTRRRVPTERVLMLRRNHVQTHHTVEQVLRLLEGTNRTLWAGCLRYALLKLPKALLGMHNYDQLKARFLRVKDNPPFKDPKARRAQR